MIVEDQNVSDCFSTYGDRPRQDGEDFLRIAAAIPVHTEVEIFPLQEANRALNSLKNDAIRGAAVLQVNAAQGQLKS